MRAFVIDLIERVVATYVEAFLGLFGAALVASLADTPEVTNLSTLEKLAAAAAVAALPAALAVLKGIVGGLIGNPDSAAIVPRSVDKKGLQFAPVPETLPFHVGVADTPRSIGKGSAVGDERDDYVAVDDKAQATALAAHAKSLAPRRRARPLKG